MQGAIAEALSTSEVAERIWAAAPNRFCADCGAAQPDWASINLCVVICKRCAGRYVCRRLAIEQQVVYRADPPLYLWWSSIIGYCPGSDLWSSFHGYTLSTGMGTHKEGKSIFSGLPGKYVSLDQSLGCWNLMSLSHQNHAGGQAHQGSSC